MLKDRVQNIIDTLTYKVYRYINRGLFEKDKITFKIMVSMKILIKDELLCPHDVNFFLKAGAAIDDKNPQFGWMDDKAWLNLCALRNHRFARSHQIFFKDLVDRISRSEPVWRRWYEDNEPEEIPVPDI